MTEETEALNVNPEPAPSENPPVRRLDEWGATMLRSLASAYGSPLYVLDLDRVRENYRRLERAFPESEVMYAVKANALGAVLETLLDVGAGLECASAGEVWRALNAGAPGSAVHYTAVNPPDRDLDLVVEAWESNPALTVTAGASDTIDRLAERGYDGRLCLRINPGIGAGHHEKVMTGGDATFGVPADRAVELLVDADERGFDVVGIHAHVGSGVSNDQLASHRAFVARVGDVAREVAEGLGGLEFVDVGGGFGVPYRDEEAPLDLARVARATRDAIGQVDATLVVEPGRYLVADAGVLLTRVNTVKPTAETTVVGVDAGMTTLARPAIYDAYHAIRNLTADASDGPEADASDGPEANTSDRPTIPQTVTGPICESSDVFCDGRDLPESRRGDVLAIGNAGAYGYEMASQYNSRPRPASIVLEGGEDRRSRRRETIEDVVRVEVEAAREADSTDGGADRSAGAVDRETSNIGENP